MPILEFYLLHNLLNKMVDLFTTFLLSTYFHFIYFLIVLNFIFLNFLLLKLSIFNLVFSSLLNHLDFFYHFFTLISNLSSHCIFLASHDAFVHFILSLKYYLKVGKDCCFFHLNCLFFTSRINQHFVNQYYYQIL